MTRHISAWLSGKDHELLSYEMVPGCVTLPPGRGTPSRVGSSLTLRNKLSQEIQCEAKDVTGKGCPGGEQQSKGPQDPRYVT